MAGWYKTLTELHEPAEYRDKLDRLKAGYADVDRVAKGTPSWDTLFADFNAFHTRLYNVWGVLYTQGDWDAIEAREAQLAAWQTKLTAEKKYDGPIQPVAKDPLDRVLDSAAGSASEAGSALGGLGTVAALAVAAYVAYKVLR